MQSRSELIFRELRRSGEVSVDSLASLFNVTPMTIRRDLADMEQRGLLRRTHGGAVAVEPMLYEPFRHDVKFQEQEQRHSEEKRRIGLAAAQLVNDGETLAISAGTTATQVARSLRNRDNITIITNTVNIPMELSNQSGVSVQVTGGDLRGSWFSLVGQKAADSLHDVFVDWAFIGVDGIDAERGYTSHYPEESVVNRAMVAHARRKVVVTHHEKFGRICKSLICRLAEIDLIITDSGATDAMVAPYLERGIGVKRV
ncbi:MAG: DeoR/GlpR family DNA-binding transcription regulator [Chloroflexi bacterium]|nr:DeoR/GlpR family DNA-binding transcription regulator [Chloroflexota bacterium]MCC6895522.1 DeoR/GlpR transcriptional regulator [Anaerolineae bacterium]